jgi:hypothetical protein
MLRAAAAMSRRSWRRAAFMTLLSPRRAQT